MNRLPSLYLSHGAPTLPIDPTLPSGAFTHLGAELPRPRAVLMLSAHWGTQRPVASVAAHPDTIHDFHGFPQALYDIRYPAPGAPDVAERAATLLNAAGTATAMPIPVATSASPIGPATTSMLADALCVIAVSA